MKRNLVHLLGTVSSKHARIAIRCGVSALMAVMTIAAAASIVQFKPVQTYSVGNPAWVVVGDFNNDGKRDMVVINKGDPTVNDPGGVSVFLGNGDGTFQSAKNVAIGKNCTNAMVGNFNGDGNMDLAPLRPGDPNVSDDFDVTIFLGNGDGTFNQGQVLMPGKNPSSVNSSIIALDLNGDQRLDLIVANSGDKSFSVLLGNGDGTFQRSYVLSLDTNSITFDGSGNATAALTINAGSSAAWLTSPVLFRSFHGIALWLPMTGFAFLGTGLGAGFSKTRRVLMFLAAAIISCGLIASVACGGGGAGGPKGTATRLPSPAILGRRNIRRA